MDLQIQTFLAVAGIDDEAIAKQYLELTGGNLDYAVTLFMESHPLLNLREPSNNDEEVAQRLQQEVYNEPNDVREADSNVHRYDTLIDSMGSSVPSFAGPRPTDIFGSARVGIFNQRFDTDENDYYEDRNNEYDDSDDNDDAPYDDDVDDDEIMILDSDEEQGERPRSRRRLNRHERISELTSTQRRLANLFRPPFDIMSKIDLDTAKIEGRKEKKWILINLQDAMEFQCQVLNRDFWSSTKVKSIVKENFIFLQFHHDSPNGINYLNFYSTDGLPHISIIDPMTGERVYKWEDGKVPEVNKWVSDVEEFLSKFSLLPNSNNPMVKHEVKFDPDALSEEQQIELAMKQSMQGGTSINTAIEVDESDAPEEEEVELDPFDSIQAKEHDEPTSGDTTRVQIRFPNGKRLVHKFSLNEKVGVIYAWLKYILANHTEEYGITSSNRFTLSNSSNKSVRLIDSLDLSLQDASLKNASILLENE